MAGLCRRGSSHWVFLVSVQKQESIHYMVFEFSFGNLFYSHPSGSTIQVTQWTGCKIELSYCGRCRMCAHLNEPVLPIQAKEKEADWKIEKKNSLCYTAPINRPCSNSPSDPAEFLFSSCVWLTLSDCTCPNPERLNQTRWQRNQKDFNLSIWVMSGLSTRQGYNHNIQRLLPVQTSTPLIQWPDSRVS